MTTIQIYDITKKEEENILSLFRIPITFFGTDDDDDIDDDDDDVDGKDLDDDDDDDHDHDDDDDDDDIDNNDDDVDSKDLDDDGDNKSSDKSKNSGKDNEDSEKDDKDAEKDSEEPEKDDKDAEKDSEEPEKDDKNTEKDNEEPKKDDKNDQKNDGDSKEDSKNPSKVEDNKNVKSDDDKASEKNSAPKNDMVKPGGNTDDTNFSGNSAPPKGNVPNTSNQVGKNNAPADKNKGPNAADRARNMKPKDTSSPSSSNNVKPNSGDSKNVPGVGGALKAKQGLDAIKNAKDDPMGAIEKGGTEAAKLGAKAIGNAVAPGAGEAVAKAIDVTDKLLEKTELGRKSKKACCIGTLTCSCLSFLSSLVVFFLPILVLLVIGNLIFDIFQVDDQLEKENPEQNFVHVIEEDTLNRPNTSLLDILEDALEDVGYYKQKEADEKGEEYEDENGSSTVFYALLENYSISRLKYPANDSKPEDFPEGQEDFREYYIPNNVSPYFSMEKKHMPLFQDVLDNLLEEDYNRLSGEEKLKANVLKKLFNNERKVVEFIDEKLTKELDKKYSNIYNPVTKLHEDSLSLRDLFEETSTNLGDAKYDVNTVARILRAVPNKEIAKAYYDLQENLTKLEIMTYMQAYRQFYMARDTMIRNANSGGYVLPDVYFTDEFFTQFSTISDVATYFSLAMLSDDPSIVYEIAREHIYIYNDPIEVTVKDFNGKRAGYIPILKTWYGDYTFDLIQTGNDFVLQCTGCTSKQIEEQSWEDRSNILQRYSIDDKDQFFALFMEATGIDPVEGKENIYSPYELDGTWQTTVTFDSGVTRAYSPGIYSYKTATSSYLSNNNTPAGSPSYSYSTTTYLTESGGSFPLAASNVTVTMNFMERYPQYIIDKYGTSEYHRGIDYSVPIGTPVLAIREGTITYAGPSSGYGYYVEVTHPDGSRSRYGHGNGVFNVSVGDKVSAGTQIMESGNSGNSTGPHMHLEVIGPNGQLIDPNKYIYENPY